ncbi:hypothetical protein LguiA_025870 [Lonicera macranthoides]
MAFTINREEELRTVLQKGEIGTVEDRKVSRHKIQEQRKSLPIASVEKQLVEEVRNNDTLIIVGETGSGKTTQLPQYLFNGGFCRDGGIVGITQPRRVAAVTVAKRVAEECGVELGQKVGYSIRFEDVTSSSTRIKYMTDGLLLREALLDPCLSRYSVIIVDEAHERTVHTDVLLGLLKSVQKARSGRLVNDPPKVDNMKASNGMLFKKENVAHNVILATNIAETSVTIPGIKYVIDPGLVKARNYCSNTGVESLIIVKTSKAQALQRSGRAGREGPGKCFRLYPESEFERLKDSTVPEIKRCNLSNVILQLKVLGVDDIIGFDFMEKPDRMAIIKSLESLYLLGALTEESTLSDPVGHQMARLPVEPINGKALILASQFNCLEEMLISVAMLSVESIFYAPREKLQERNSGEMVKHFVEVIEKIKTGGRRARINEFTTYGEDGSNFIFNYAKTLNGPYMSSNMSLHYGVKANSSIVVRWFDVMI